jgi:hypothetical protein
LEIRRRQVELETYCSSLDAFLWQQTRTILPRQTSQRGRRHVQEDLYNKSAVYNPEYINCAGRFKHRHLSPALEAKAEQRNENKHQPISPASDEILKITPPLHSPFPFLLSLITPTALIVTLAVPKNSVSISACISSSVALSVSPLRLYPALLTTISIWKSSPQ